MQLSNSSITGLDRFKNLKASYLATDLMARVHGNTKHQRKNVLRIEDIKNLLTFLSNYAENKAILLPGHIPGYQRDTTQLLPSSTINKVHTVLYTHTHSQCLPTLHTPTYAYTHTHKHLTHTHTTHTHTHTHTHSLIFRRVSLG